MMSRVSSRAPRPVSSAPTALLKTSDRCECGSDWLNVSSLRNSSQPSVGTVLSMLPAAPPARNALHTKSRNKKHRHDSERENRSAQYSRYGPKVSARPSLLSLSC